MFRPPEQRPVKLLRKRLDAAGVMEHFRALAAHAQAVEVRVKGAKLDHSDASTSPLEEVARRLGDGQILAVQVRFSLDGAWWCDTVMRRGDSFRLVRMPQDDQPVA